jgi:YfiH family protein
MPAEAGVRGWLRPVWAAPPRVRALMSTRRARPSARGADFDPGREGSQPDAAANRLLLAAELGASPVWLRQVHGAAVVRVDRWQDAEAPVADAAVSATPGAACVVLVADCLPVLLCDDRGRAVAAAHAGWRGLAAGVLERSVATLCDAAACDPREVHAWFGPSIGPRQFEVGVDVLLAFGADPDGPAAACFVRRDRPDGDRRWLADLPALARQRLLQAGVSRISGGGWCTVEDASTFFSFRRDGAVGRMAAAIAIVD